MSVNGRALSVARLLWASVCSLPVLGDEPTVSSLADPMYIFIHVLKKALTFVPTSSILLLKPAGWQPNDIARRGTMAVMVEHSVIEHKVVAAQTARLVLCLASLLLVLLVLVDRKSVV